MDLSEVTKFEEKREEKAHMPALLWLCAELKARDDDHFTFRQCYKTWGCLLAVSLGGPIFGDEVHCWSHQYWEACALTKVAARTGMLDRFFMGSQAHELVIQKMVGLGCPLALAQHICVRVISLNDGGHCSYEAIADHLLIEFS